MSKGKFSKYKQSTILMEIQGLKLEKFLNLLWKNGIYIKNIKRINITTMQMDVRLKDYDEIIDCSKKTKTKIKILNRKGIDFLFLDKKVFLELIIAISMFILVILYLSTFVWKININTENVISPFEIRNELKAYGIKPGIKKSKIDVHKLEEEILKDNDNIMWVRARVDGANLNINLCENQSPPKVNIEDYPCDLVAKMDGEILRVYTKAGTPIVKKGDIVKKGQILVKGEEGNEEQNYEVHSEGSVIAKTFYEEYKQIPIKTVKRVRTGRKLEKIYIDINGKKIYFKNDLNKFNKYDKILNEKSFIKKEIYYEVKEKQLTKNQKEAEKEAENILTKNIMQNLDKSVKMVNRVVNTNIEGNKYCIRLLVIAEQNIAVPQKVQENKDDKENKENKDNQEKKE